MRQKFTSKIRPEFRRLLKDFRTWQALADYLGTSVPNVGMMKSRGYMSVRLAEFVEVESDGKYKCRLLAKRGEIKGLSLS